MFITCNENKYGIRSGKYVINGKSVKTPTIFAISDIGGGGGSVDRFISYIDMFYSQGLPILMNYYYLTEGGSVSINWVRKIKTNEGILDFLSRRNKEMKSNGKVSNNYSPIQSNYTTPIVMLDSGSGNFVRDFARNGTRDDIISGLEGRIENYYEYGQNHGFDILIALDYAFKKTNKAGESSDSNYKDTAGQLIIGNENLDILRKSLVKYKNGNYSFMLFAPIHGETSIEISHSLEKILKIEDIIEAKFSGFAITFPNTRTNQEMSRGEFIQCIGYAARRVLRERKDQRPIHALGMGGAGNVLSLVSSGVDSFDTHTPWRRAMDGENPSSANFKNSTNAYSKYLNPLINQNLDIIENKPGSEALKYLILPKILNTIQPDCPICMKYPIKQLKQLYNNKNKEDFYLSKMLIYMHSVLQSKYIGQALVKASQNETDFQLFINSLPSKYRLIFSGNSKCWNQEILSDKM